MLRTCVFACALAGTLGLLMGCDRGSDPKTTHSKTTQAQDNPRQETQKKLNARLDEMDRKLAELKSRADKATGQEKVKLEEQWKASAGKREEFARKLDLFKAAADNKWQEAKNEAEHSYEELLKQLGQ